MPTHAEKKVLPYTPEQMYRLVADVEKYPEFLPWCLAARIRRREGDVMFADLVIGFKMVRERFTSRVELDEANRRINVQYTEGPFQYLNNHWIFTPHEGGVCVDFYVDFEFRSKMLQKIMGVLFNEAVRRMVQAFETRANQLYGAGASRPAAARTA
ncbi:ubiquinone-binding protein (plasmid) [Azospirillum baldaniorum]|uniref:Oligoketide cyclase/dehydratase n=1 Tax=Azospirillum baldaniorum TaxID=1064539 RepID=A0A9P1JTJ1_9PROT|nr:type II toxin-antitoxin system RatA family toxin [Azospirillum baldaniorum]TWA83873.1 coenzyme Q-binding protein COQ10 [Azospirillum brasilense]AWJ91281.1 ubiquinone-binding protein [Azospirillum baldaniorum]NUB05715.1 type II toxin-antitoxin system RatA family toxin [Azospirillum baldaniorum]TWA70568.1 coenzyme Q-binding protein COQ10 [Azospirillum baldaniorum]CCC99528.1 putative oligoketide cyclase/dehydratase [Azospirillum baldaniorum]